MGGFMYLVLQPKDCFRDIVNIINFGIVQCWNIEVRTASPGFYQKYFCLPWKHVPRTTEQKKVVKVNVKCISGYDTGCATPEQLCSLCYNMSALRQSLIHSMKSGTTLCFCEFQSSISTSRRCVETSRSISIVRRKNKQPSSSIPPVQSNNPLKPPHIPTLPPRQ